MSMRSAARSRAAALRSSARSFHAPILTRSAARSSRAPILTRSAARSLCALGETLDRFNSVRHQILSFINFCFFFFHF